MKPREFWINKEDAEPYEYNPLPLKPDADKIHNFIHVREVMPDVPQCRMTEKEFTEIHEQIIYLNKRLDRVTRALRKAKEVFRFQCNINLLKEIEAIESGEDKNK